MPIINVKFIENVVATPEQKHELVVKLTEAFVGVLGDVVRPFTYVVIEETKVGDWGIAGRPMPDLDFLVGAEYKAIYQKSVDLMNAAIAQMKAQAGGAAPSDGAGASKTAEQADADKRAEQAWLGGR
jgi:4-oxalocrotonate tautomerase